MGDEYSREQHLLFAIRKKFCGDVSAELARQLGMNPTYVNRLLYPIGKTGRKGIGLEVMRKASEKFSLPPGYWELPDASAAPAHEASSEFAPLHQPTIEDAIEKLAEVLQALDEDGRRMASTVLSNLAKNPARAAGAAEMLRSVMKLNGRTPEPQPPRGGTRKRQPAASERKAEPRPKLTVTAGGGKKMQYDLPLQKALNPENDPFDERNAPANERSWYRQVKKAPKASE